MYEDIEEYNLGPEEAIDHDAIITEQAGKLMKIGYLEYEVAGYATAVYRNGDVYYYISAKEESASKFVHQCYQEGQYPTPIQYFYKRYDLLHMTEEDAKNHFRNEVLYKMQEMYPRVLFEAIEHLTAPLSNDSGLGIMKELAGQLENCFDLSQLRIYEDLLNILLPSRLISVAGYQLMMHWYEREVEKLSIEPIKVGEYHRTYGGFAYQKDDGPIKYFVDAFPYMAHERQTLYLSQGYVVTPILTSTYCVKTFEALFALSGVYKKELEYYLNENYIKVMKLFRSLPSTVNKDAFLAYREKVAATGKPKALEALDYYGYLWNVV